MGIYHFYKYRGFTLIEVMISLTLGLFLLTLSMQSLIAMNKSFALIKSSSRMQETARFTFALLENDIKQSRYWANALAFSNFTGSASLTDINNTSCLEGGTSWGRQLKQTIFAVNNSANTYACVNNDSYLQGDILTLRYANTQPLSSYDNEQIYVRSLSNQHRLFIGKDRGLAMNNDLPSPISQLIIAHSFFIADSSRTCKGKLIPALFWQTLVNGRPQKEELLAGVEHLQIQFTIDADIDGKADKYVNPDQITNWQLVHSVKVDLLVRSDCPDASHLDNKTYQLADVSYQVNDHFYRQQYQYTFNYR
ncbi:PilW family protein [Thalassotalea psychrophila]|uniref:PilW family protein n=1 Tax=Thalassotalea psychrophila TaxID=3065647 RepID=A0ABY9TX48_9GAMM|nr:PilW family protein [Colwelliaceae bacterium SQ149]